MINELVISLFDEGTETLTLCCTVCGSLEDFDMSQVEDEDEMLEVTSALEHRLGCFVRAGWTMN